MPLSLPKEVLLQCLRQSLVMMGGLHSPHGTHQASSHLELTPPRGHSLPVRTPRIDGKEFFRQARSRLSYDQFSAFLANIKELNAQKQTREDALRKAEELFGTENQDLFLSYQGLLNRNVCWILFYLSR